MFQPMNIIDDVTAALFHKEMIKGYVKVTILIRFS